MQVQERIDTLRRVGIRVTKTVSRQNRSEAAAKARKRAGQHVLRLTQRFNRDKPFVFIRHMPSRQKVGSPAKSVGEFSPDLRGSMTLGFSRNASRDGLWQDKSCLRNRSPWSTPGYDSKRSSIAPKESRASSTEKSGCMKSTAPHPSASVFCHAATPDRTAPVAAVAGRSTTS